MEKVTEAADWQKFWESTREMFDKGEIPGGNFYQKLLKHATLRLDVAGENTLKAITYEEFYYLLSRFPALVIRHPDIEHFPAAAKPTITKAASGWDIYDYGQWIATSSGRLSWGSYKAGSQVENSSIVQGNGTLVKQFVDTAYEVIELVIKKDWGTAQVVHGFYGMIRAAWVASEIMSFNLEGFYPTANDQVVLSWVKTLLDKKQKQTLERIKQLRKKIDPTAG